MNFRDESKSQFISRVNNNNNNNNNNNSNSSSSKEPVKNDDLDKIHTVASQTRPTNLSLFDTREMSARSTHDTRPEHGSVYDYSFMSSCSLPSDRASVSTPSPSLPQTRVTMRHSKNVTNNASESGRLLNSALARHFRRLQCQVSQVQHAEVTSDDSARLLSDNLYHYLVDVFSQLDSGHSGFVTRQDFESLCEILELDPAPSSSLTPGSRSSGLQWLSSYHPRPGTPASPIR